MKIPAKITVFDKTYKIKMVKNLRFTNGEPIKGCFDSESRMIALDVSLSSDDMEQVFLHELNHLILHESAIGQTSLPDDVEEVIVQQMAKVYQRIFDMKVKRKRRSKQS